MVLLTKISNWVIRLLSKAQGYHSLFFKQRMLFFCLRGAASPGGTIQSVICRSSRSSDFNLRMLKLLVMLTWDLLMKVIWVPNLLLLLRMKIELLKLVGSQHRLHIMILRIKWLTGGVKGWRSVVHNLCTIWNWLSGQYF